MHQNNCQIAAVMVYNESKRNVTIASVLRKTIFDHFVILKSSNAWHFCNSVWFQVSYNNKPSILGEKIIPQKP